MASNTDTLSSETGSVTGLDTGPRQPGGAANQIDQYVEWLESRAASVSAGDPSTDGFVPGSRRMPTR